jgi:hypothetical protein
VRRRRTPPTANRCNVRLTDPAAYVDSGNAHCSSERTRLGTTEPAVAGRDRHRARHRLAARGEVRRRADPVCDLPGDAALACRDAAAPHRRASGHCGRDRRRFADCRGRPGTQRDLAARPRLAGHGSANHAHAGAQAAPGHRLHCQGRVGVRAGGARHGSRHDQERHAGAFDLGREEIDDREHAGVGDRDPDHADGDLFPARSRTIAAGEESRPRAARANRTRDCCAWRRRSATT